MKIPVPCQCSHDKLTHDMQDGYCTVRGCLCMAYESSLPPPPHKYTMEFKEPRKVAVDKEILLPVADGVLATIALEYQIDHMLGVMRAELLEFALKEGVKLGRPAFAGRIALAAAAIVEE